MLVVVVRYDEGAEIGYRWFAKTGEKPLYAFGHGLSYTTFDYSDLEVEGGDTVTATFTVTDTGERAGADVPQLYLTDAADDERMRLLGFERVDPQPGESRHVTLTSDPRLLVLRPGTRALKGRHSWVGRASLTRAGSVPAGAISSPLPPDPHL